MEPLDPAPGCSPGDRVFVAGYEHDGNKGQSVSKISACCGLRNVWTSIVLLHVYAELEQLNPKKKVFEQIQVLCTCVLYTV